MSKKKIILIACGILLIICLIVVTLIINNNTTSDGTDNYIRDDTIEETKKYRNKIQKVNDIASFNTVKICLQKFYMYYSRLYNEDVINSDNADLNLEYYKKVVYDFLSNDYITRNEITEENIDSKLEKISDVNVEVYNMFYISNYDYVSEDYSNMNMNPREIRAYFVKGILRDNNSSKEFSNIVCMDMVNSTFSIDLDVYNNLDYAKLKEEEDIKYLLPEGIDIKELNKYSFVSTSYEDISSSIFDNIRSLLLYDSEKAYDMLTDYSKENFGNLQEFKNYIESNKNDILLMSFKIYELSYEDEKLVINMYDNGSHFLIRVYFDAFSSYKFSIENI